jgi:hypothetical protein
VQYHSDKSQFDNFVPVQTFSWAPTTISNLYTVPVSPVILLRSALGFDMLATLIFNSHCILEPFADTPTIVTAIAIAITIVTAIAILFKIYKSTIKTISRIKKMSKVIHYVKYITVWNQAEIDSESST